MPQARNAVRYVQYIWDGTGYGALVVDVELGQDHVIQSLNKNQQQEKNIMKMKIKNNDFF
jgi:hypothetical protein